MIVDHDLTGSWPAEEGWDRIDAAPAVDVEVRNEPIEPHPTDGKYLDSSGLLDGRTQLGGCLWGKAGAHAGS